MGFLKKLFGVKSESEKAKEEVQKRVQRLTQHQTQVTLENLRTQEKLKNVATAPISQVTSIPILEGSTIVAESEIPVSCSMGNLVFEKKYQEAIDLGLKLLEETPDDCGVHINLMNAYFKGRELSPDYLDKSTYHAKKSILLGHHTGYAEERLAKNLDKAKLYHQSLQLYNLILDNKEFHFSPGGCGNSIDFAKRRDAVLKKMDKALDTENDILFTQDEINQIVQGIKDADKQREEDSIQYDAESKRLEELTTAKLIASLRGNTEEFERLEKEYRAFIQNSKFFKHFCEMEEKLSQLRQ